MFDRVYLKTTTPSPFFTTLSPLYHYFYSLSTLLRALAPPKLDNPPPKLDNPPPRSRQSAAMSSGSSSNTAVSTRSRPEPAPTTPEIEQFGPTAIAILCRGLNVTQEGRKEDVHDRIKEAILDIKINLLDPSFTTGKKYVDPVPSDLIGLAAVKALCRAKQISDLGAAGELKEKLEKHLEVIISAAQVEHRGMLSTSRLSLLTTPSQQLRQPNRHYHHQEGRQWSTNETARADEVPNWLVNPSNPRLNQPRRYLTHGSWR